MKSDLPRLRTILPEASQISSVNVVPRTLHGDPRGFLLETLRRDDKSIQGDHFAMTYVSVTVPGEFRDRDRWHIHKIQTDRFVVAVGEMILVLYDNRGASPTRGRIEAIRMVGAPYDRLSPPTKQDIATFLVSIPPGVCHCIGNLSRHPFVLVNSPTELYDPADEGRLPFADVHVDSLGGPFEWTRVETDHLNP
jgi:dTDP-4-dehydrorhamnose 3,5-epimerase-like enzyme